MKRSTPPVCLLLLVGAIAAQQPTSVVTSLQQLCSEHPAADTVHWDTLLQQPRLGQDSNDNLLSANESLQLVAPDVIFELLSSLHQAAIDENKLHLQLTGQSVIALGDPKEVAAVGQQLRFANDVLARPLQIEFCAWDATDRETPPAVMNAAEFQRFATNRPQLWRCASTTQPGAAISLAREHWTRYVRNLEVEVAQKQSAVHAQTDAFAEGGRALVRPLPLLGDEFVLQAQFIAGQRRGIVRTLSTGVPGAPDLDVPTLETSYGACSARVPNGGAMAITLRGNPAGGGQTVLTIRVSSKQPPVNPIQGRLALFPCGALLSPALNRRVPTPSPCRGEASDVGNEQEPFGLLEPQQLEDVVRGAFAAEFEKEATAWRCGSGVVFVRCDEAVLGQIETALRTLQDQLLRNVTVQQTGTLAPVEGTLGTTSPNLHELTFPTLQGREAVMARLLETTYVRNANVEIAQEASILVPEVDTLQVGTWMRLRAAPVGEQMHADLTVQCSHSPTPVARSIQAGGGTLTPPDLTVTTVQHDGTVAPGQAIDQGDGPAISIDGRTCRSTLTTTLRW